MDADFSASGRSKNSLTILPAGMATFASILDTEDNVIRLRSVGAIEVESQ